MPLAVPAGHGIIDIAPDGKTLLTRAVETGAEWTGRTYLVPLATMKPTALADKPLLGLRFSPDGRRVLGVPGRDGGRELLVIDVATRAESKVRVPEEAEFVSDACWSPDGRRILFHWSERVPQPPGVPVPVGGGGWQASRLSVADPVGGNAKTILRNPYDKTISGIDWR